MGPLFGSAIAVGLATNVGLFALKSLGGSVEEAGFYGAAQSLTLLPSIFAGAFTSVLLSTLGRMRREGGPARALGRDALRVPLLLLPFAGLTAGAAPEIVELVFGGAFAPAAALLALLIFAALAWTMVSIDTALLTAAGKPGWTLALTAPLLPIALAGHLVFVPPLGSIGAALVTTVVAGLGVLVMGPAVYHVWGVLPPANTVWRSILLTGLAYGLAASAPAPGHLLLLKLPVIMLIIVLAFLWLGELRPSEVSLLGSALRGWTQGHRGSRLSDEPPARRALD
jgi:O-antigen/teichoic acid export membrane protein